MQHANSNKISLLLLFLGITISSFPQQFSIRGKVCDKTTGAPLSAVSVQDLEYGGGTVTNENGEFRIRTGSGTHRLAFSCIGYLRKDTVLNVSSGLKMVILLEQLAYKVGEVTVSAEEQKDQVNSMQTGTFTISGKQISKLPSLLGEVDPLKILQLTPGVQSASYGGVGFNVRGGGTDQNLILYDNTIVYNPGHLLGIFSVFNSDLIKNLSIVKSGIPAQYGGKLSSVIIMDSYKGNPDSFEIKGSTGLISSKITAGGPLFGHRGTFILGARRTYLQLLVKPIIMHTVSSTSFLVKDNLYNFYDFNLGADLNLGDKDMLSVTAYHGRDSYSMDQSGFRQKNYLNWGNTMAALSWKHKKGIRSYINTNLSYTRYDFDLAGSQADYSFGLFSSIDDYSIKSEYSTKSERNSFLTGLELTSHSFTPNRINGKAGNFSLNFAQFVDMQALEGGVYLNDEFNINPELSVSAGLRLSFFDHHGPYTQYKRNAAGQVTDTLSFPFGKSLAFYSEPEPRLVMKYRIGSNSAVKASYTHIAQYIHLATSASASLPADVWIPSTSGIKPLTGDQVSMGYFRNFKESGFEFSTEVYYKYMRNQLEFLRGIVNISIDGNMDNNLAVGKGRAYGLELFLARKIGKSTGWLSYTLAKTELQFDQINQGYFYPAKYDRRHDISFTMSRELNEKWSASVVFVYISGSAFTMPVGRYIIQGIVVNQYGDVNSFRMPANHRMDLSLTRKIVSQKKRESELVFSVYNVYNRANPYYIYYEIVGDVEKYSLSVKAFEVSLIPIIPSISWNFRF
jgi:hypothetical protein